MITAREAAKATGRSETWLRTHFCKWCDQSALNAVRGQCSAWEGPRCTSEEAIARCFKNDLLEALRTRKVDA